MQKALGNLSCRLSQRRGGNIISTCTSWFFLHFEFYILYFVFCFIYWVEEKRKYHFHVHTFLLPKAFLFPNSQEHFFSKMIRHQTWIASCNHHPDENNNSPSCTERVCEYRPDPGSRGKTDRGRPLCSRSCEVSRDLVCAALRYHFFLSFWSQINFVLFHRTVAGRLDNTWKAFASGRTTNLLYLNLNKSRPTSNNFSLMRSQKIRSWIH